MHPSRKLGSKALSCAVLIGASACASTLQAPARHQAGPGGQGVYSTFTARDLVYDHGLSGRARQEHVRSRPEIDAYLKPSALAAKDRPRRERSRPAAVPRVATPAVAESRVAVAAAGQPPARVLATPPPASDYERYAARERRGSDQMQYRGGDVIVISVSTLLVILLIVLIVLLLT